MSEALTAYLYRRAPLDESGLRALIGKYVFGADQVFAFAANTLELQAIYSCDTADNIRLTGDAGEYDFGHVFSRQVEVRWKRAGQGYDALVLTEQAIRELAGVELRPERRLLARTPPPDVTILLEGPPAGRRLGYVEYLAENGAVQFQRYTALR